MKINLVAIGTKMPSWVEEGFHTYTKRLPQTLQLNLIEVEGPKHHRNGSPSQWLAEEGKLLLDAIPPRSEIIALDRTGKALSSKALATQLQRYQDESRDISLLVGGPDGLDPSCTQQAQTSWSLSALTLPHPLVRVVIAEQVYRAWSILNHHPYHR